MNAPPRILVLLFALVCLPGLYADEAADKEADIKRMKQIWEGIHAYKREHGKLPDRLSNLVPKFLADQKLLVSPAEKDRPEAELKYSYEFGVERGENAREIRGRQMEEYGGIVPILRCFVHQPTVLNLSYDGDVFESAGSWELSPALKQLIEKRGLGPGFKDGRKLRIVVTGPDDKPVEGVTIRATRRRFRNSPLPDRTITSGPDGVALLPICEVGKSLARLAFEKAGYAAPERGWPPVQNADADPPLAPLPEDRDPTLEVKFWAAMDVAGVIRDLDGKALSDVQLLLRRLKPDGTVIEILGRCATDEQGKWRLANCPRVAGLELVSKHSKCRVETVRLDLNEIPTAKNLQSAFAQIQLRPPQSLTGRITADGRPIGGANVWLLPPNEAFAEREIRRGILATTNADGWFSHEIRADGDATLFVVAKDLAPHDKKISLKADQPTQTDIALDAGQNRSGRILHAAKHGLPDVPIVLIGVGTIPLSAYPVIATTDKDGYFQWANAPKRTLRFQALLPDGREWYFQWDCAAEKPVEVRVPVQSIGCE